MKLVRLNDMIFEEYIKILQENKKLLVSVHSEEIAEYTKSTKVVMTFTYLKEDKEKPEKIIWNCS